MRYPPFPITLPERIRRRLQRLAALKAELERHQQMVRLINGRDAATADAPASTPTIHSPPSCPG